RERCEACDVCLGETVQGGDTAGVAAKILGAVGGLRGRFGAAHVTDVLAGAAAGRIGQLGHHRLRAHATLRRAEKAPVRARIDQLLGHGLLARTDDEYPTVMLTERGRAVLRGEDEAPALTSAGAVRATAADAAPLGERDTMAGIARGASTGERDRPERL